MVELGADVRALLAQAQRTAQRHGARPSTGHLTLAMLESQGDAGQLLEGHGARAVPLYEVLKQVEREADNAIELCLERARRIALQSGARKARSLHVLLAAVQNARNEAYRGLVAMGVPVEVLRQTLEDSLGLRGAPSAQIRERPAARESRIVESTRLSAEALKPLPRTLIDWEAQKRSQSGGSLRATRQQQAEPRAQPPELARVPDSPRGETTKLDEREFPLLASLGRNLTLEAAEGRIDPVVGRDAEIEQVLDVLARRRANNPILVGPPAWARRRSPRASPCACSRSRARTSRAGS